ncbi:hypothetical protein PRIC2_011906 [Phytophthora ramorum]
MIINKVLNERDERLSVYTISTCTRSKEERLIRKLGYHYKTIDAMEEVDDSIDSYAWQENLTEDHEGHRMGCMQYFKDNLQGVLHQDGSPRTSSPPNPKYYLKDTWQMKNLLDLDASSSVPFGVKGTTEMMIIDDAAKDLDDVFAGLHFVIELKKDHCGAEDRCKILVELVAADLKSEKRCAPIGLLTNLNDYWYFLWFTPEREIARMMLTCPANGFKMMEELTLTNSRSDTGVFPMRTMMSQQN